MKESVKDKLEGVMHEAKGTVKEKIGQVTKKPNLTAEGVDEKTTGQIQKKVADVERVFEK